MVDIFGNRWLSQYGAELSKPWLKALEGLTGRQIAHGLEKCVKEWVDGWPPTPGQFRELCKITAKDLGLPDADKAFVEAMRATGALRDDKPFAWTHAVVYHAAKETGVGTLTTSKDAEKVFARNYEIACRMLADGEQLREIPKALPEKVSVVTKEVGVQHLTKIRELLGSAGV